MQTGSLPRLTAGGIELDTAPENFGFLEDSRDLMGDPVGLRSRMEQDGYLYLPGFFDRDQVTEVRRSICEVLSREGQLDPLQPVEAGVAQPGIEMYFRPDILKEPTVSGPLRALIYGPKMMAFYREFLGGDAMHYEYTWLRVIAPGLGTYPHCDVVYMGRGTKNLFTAWVPYGDIPLHVGGLCLIEGSHHNRGLREGYCTMDVDTACRNRSGESALNAAGFPGFGALSFDMRETRKSLGGRLLTAPEFKMGDLLTFSIYTVHGSLDNQSQEFRLSSDSRYQLASEPADERWIGENPPAHGGAVIKDMIC